MKLWRVIVFSNHAQKWRQICCESVQPARVSFFRSDLFQNWYFSWGLTFAIGKSNLEFLLGARKQRGKYGTLSDIAYWYFFVVLIMLISIYYQGLVLFQLAEQLLNKINSRPTYVKKIGENSNLI